MTSETQQIRSSLSKPIVLIGMMGAGKTQIGRALAKTLDLEFSDSDAEIEKAASCSIPDIFEFYGEQAFRDVEKRVLRRLTTQGLRVVATGGGAFVNEQTRAHLLKNSLVIWLNASAETLYTRVAGHTHRPLLQTPDPKQKLMELLEERKEFYEQAHIHVPSKDVNMQETLQKLLSLLKAYLAENSEINQDKPVRQK